MGDGYVQAVILKDQVTAMDEYQAMYRWICSYLKDNESYGYDDIAILVRQRKQCDVIKAALMGFGLPVYVDREKGFFQQQEISTYFPKLSTELNGFINFSWNIQNVCKFVRAFSYPFKGAIFNYKDF